MGKVVLFKFLDFTWGIVSMIPALLAVGGAFAISISPTEPHGLLMQWLGLLLPLILAINFLLIVYWTIRKKWFALPLLISILLNIPFISRVFQYPLKPEIQQQSENNLRVASYNVGDMRFINWWILDGEAIHFIKEERIDILCLQEFPDDKKKEDDFINAIQEPMPFHTILSSEKGGMKVALFCRYPILQSYAIEFPFESRNSAMWADIDVKGNIVRVFNNHLQTTSISQHNLFSKRIDDVLTSDYINCINNNFILRSKQADIIRSKIEKSPYPIIVCGDFNDTPSSYTYQKIKGNLIDSFSACGKGYEYTYRYLGNLFRIDFIFYSDETFSGISHRSYNKEYSDHKPVIVDIKMKPLSTAVFRNQKQSLYPLPM